jgi:hypothetical protein
MGILRIISAGVVVAVVWTPSVTAMQLPEGTTCPAVPKPGVPETSRLALVAGSEPVETFAPYTAGKPAPGKPPAKCDPTFRNCQPWLRYDPDTIVEIVSAGSGWSCVINSGKGYAWIRTSNLTPLAVDTRPPPAAWVGTWGDNENFITITSEGNQLTIHGEAKWHGLTTSTGQVVHSGGFDARAMPTANPLTLQESGCEVTLTLLGDYMKLDDNEGCGGANVRFKGVWPRRLH